MLPPTSPKRMILTEALEKCKKMICAIEKRKGAKKGMDKGRIGVGVHVKI